MGNNTKTDLSIFLQGKGLDTSHKTTKTLKNTKHIYKPYDNTYRLHPEVDFESRDFVYNVNSINSTKFTIILLTEWARYVKNKKYLVITFTENSLLTRRKIKNIFEKYLSTHFKIVFDQKNGKTVTIVFQKIKSQAIKNDSIDKWTFGIIRTGTTPVCGGRTHTPDWQTLTTPCRR